MATYTFTDTTQLSTHFNVQEFRCKCGRSHDILISGELVNMLEKLYTALNCSKIIVNSGYRCTEHDKAVGGSGNGQHTKGKAADVVCYDQLDNIISSKTVCCKAQDLGFGGIANITNAYTSTHLDVRSGSTWYGDETKGTSTVTSDFYSYFGVSIVPKSTVKGIDVSKHNGTIDWDKVKASGIQFAIIRIGYGSDMESQDDTQALRNMSECDRVGIPYGVYLYSYALNTTDAKSEANHALRMISGKNPVLGVWFDMEDADGYKEKHGKPLNAANGVLYSDICRTFCSKVEHSGVYSSKSVLTNILNVSDLPIWVAQWASKCTYNGSYDIWQYSNVGRVNGISGNVDLDYLYRDVYSNANISITQESKDTLEQILEHVASIDEKLK